MQHTAHVDSFARDNLPTENQMPDFLLDGFDYPEFLNAGYELTDAMVAKGFGDHTALIGNGRLRTYKELTDWTNRLANVLVDDLGVKPGNRVLIRSANNPAMLACWLAATKAGAVVVNTMPMLRAAELEKYVDLAEIEFALCDTRLLDELATCVKTQTRSDDVALLGFTSGSTGTPKATMHFHRDIVIIADGYGKEVLGVTSEDVFVGSPPLAFTFGLGGLAVFPLRFGATATLLEQATPPNMIEIIQKHKATVCFTAPTAYRVMLRAMDEGADLSSLRAAVSAGETLPEPVYQEWIDKTGKPMLDGIGATEMLHIFISNRFDDHRPACTGKPVSGYEAKVLRADGSDADIGEVGRLAVRGPTGCRYLKGDRQDTYVEGGWNITGDSFSKDKDGYFHFAARNDDMIISSGYNIAGPEVEAALLHHPDVVECGVIGVSDPERGQIVQAHVVLETNATADAEKIKTLQDHVKATIAPYKYPRSIVFRDDLPKTATGKIQRCRSTAFDPELTVRGAR